MRNYSIKSTKWLNRGHEMDYMASIIMRPDNNIYIVGESEEIRSFYKRVGNSITVGGVVKGIVRTESTSSIEGIDVPVVHDGDIPQSINTIIICTSRSRTAYESARGVFEGYGFEENRQFFQGEVYIAVYEAYVLDRICLDRVEIFLTSYCPLKCEKCIAYIPYFEKYEHTPVERLKEDVDLLFSKADYVYKYKVLGGDGLVYPELPEYLEYVCEKYRDRIESVIIGTNGTIVPSDDIMMLCGRYNIMLDVSDYRCAIGKRSHLEEIVSKCEKWSVRADVKRTGEQWLDMGFPKRPPGKKDEEHLRMHYSKCAMYCRDFDDGKLYHCCSNFAAVKAGIFLANDNDYFDFKKDFTKKELMEYELGFCDKGYTTFCEVCRGCSDEVNPFHTQVAKQVENIL